MSLKYDSINDIKENNLDNGEWFEREAGVKPLLMETSLAYQVEWEKACSWKWRRKALGSSQERVLVGGCGAAELEKMQLSGGLGGILDSTFPGTIEHIWEIAHLD
ncbi:unnamed protein product [Caretta caretta]